MSALTREDGAESQTSRVESFNVPSTQWLRNQRGMEMEDVDVEYSGCGMGEDISQSVIEHVAGRAFTAGMADNASSMSLLDKSCDGELWLFCWSCVVVG